MNRFFAVTAAVLLCACLVSCGKTPPAPPEPSSTQEVESIIEPLEFSEVPEASGEPSEPNESAAPDSGAAYSGEEKAVSGEPQPESLPEPQIPAPAKAPEPSSSMPETLPSVSANRMLDQEKIELELLRLINEERASAGVEPLGIEENILFAARIRAGEAISDFSHTRPNGEPYNTAFDEAGFSYAGKWHGENLASLRFTTGMFDEASAALEMFTGLKNSPGHYRNMVSDKFLQAGVGVAIAFGPNDISIASVQLFSSL